jgi:hypothetical protein
VFGRRPIVGEWKRMSPPERVQWCEAKLNRLAELQHMIDQDRGSPDYAEATRNVTDARQQITNVLNSLHGARMPAEYLTLWGRLNRWVSDWAAADRRREEAERANAACWRCSGRGKTIEGSYHYYFASCPDCGGTGRRDNRYRAF